MRKNLVTESRGIRLLEAQIATGGLIDPRVILIPCNSSVLAQHREIPYCLTFVSVLILAY